MPALQAAEGKVQQSVSDDRILNERNRILLDRLRPILYDEEAGQYLSLGKKEADAFRAGIELKKSLEGAIHG